MQTKTLTIEDMTDAGIGLARLATLSSVDSDGDTYEAGAFGWKSGEQQWAPIIVAHDRRTMPFGKTRVYEKSDEALAELHLNLDTQLGRDWHAALKFDLAKGEPVQEWSYGYEVLDAQELWRGRDRVRSIKRIDVHEVSTVIRGAGVGTRTLAMKSAKLKEAHFAPLVASLGELADALPGNPAALSATGRKQLEEIHVAIGKALDGGKDASCATCAGAFNPKELEDGNCAQCAAAIAAGKAATEDALAQWLRQQSKRHLND